MQLSILLAIAGFTSTTIAQNYQDFFPKCAVDCIGKATKDATACSLEDAVCMCVQKNYEGIYNSGLTCVMQSCGPDQSISAVLPAGVKFCAAATSQAKAGGASKTSGAPPPATSTPAVTAANNSTGKPAATTTTSTGAAATDGPVKAIGLVVAGLLAVL